MRCYKKLKACVVAHICNPHRGCEEQESSVIPDYIASSRPVSAVRDPISENNIKVLNT